METRGASLWSDGCTTSKRPRLTNDSVHDVAIVGAGYSGLWLAYWLTEYDPTLDVILIERDQVGFGASGRNGGWVSALLPTSLTSLSSSIGEGPTVRLQGLMFDAVHQIERICVTHSIDCRFELGGSISLIRGSEQRRRSVADLLDYERFGFGDHARLLDEKATSKRVVFDGESVFRPDCAVIHPKRLVHGLASIVEERGVRIVEDTMAVAIEAGEVRTEHATVRASHVIDCREAFGAPDSRRRVVPIYSLMVATEPLSDDTWASVGLPNREAFTDHRRQLVYGQRTDDGRLAFGGRGVGYHYGSTIDPSFDLHRRVHAQLHESLIELFPVLRHTSITHRWGGPLAVPRDWTWTVSHDRETGLGVTGGYSGDGVTSSFVAGRAMARSIVNQPDDCPLFGHRSPRWEREPIRWVGINAMTRLAGLLDSRDARGRRSPLLGSLFDRVVG